MKALLAVCSCSCVYRVISPALRTCVKVFWVAANCKIIQNPHTLMLSSNANNMEECQFVLLSCILWKHPVKEMLHAFSFSESKFAWLYLMEKIQHPQDRYDTRNGALGKIEFSELNICFPCVKILGCNWNYILMNASMSEVKLGVKLAWLCGKV